MTQPQAKLMKCVVLFICRIRMAFAQLLCRRECRLRYCTKPRELKNIGICMVEVLTFFWVVV